MSEETCIATPQLRITHKLHRIAPPILWLLTIVSSGTAERLPVKTYTVADGLLRDTVTRIRQDSRGFLWFCTGEGLSRFDGYGFTNFRADDGLPDRHVNDILETRAGVYLIATSGGLTRLNPTGIRNSQDHPLFTVFLPEDPKAKGFRVLFQDSSNQIFAGTTDGLYRIEKAAEALSLERVPLGDVPSASRITAIIEDRRGGLWIGTTNGLVRLLASGQTELYTTANGLPNNSIESLVEDVNGKVWAGLRDHETNLVRLVDQPTPNQPIVARAYSRKDGLPSSRTPNLFQASDGKFWIATIAGLCLWQGDQSGSVCETYTAKNGLCDDDIWSVIEDKDGNLWVGSRCGAKKIARYGFTTYGPDDGLKPTMVHAIFEDQAGELMFASNEPVAPLTRFDGDRFTSSSAHLPVTQFGWGWKNRSWQDRAGAWWIPTGHGLFRYPEKSSFSDLASRVPEKIKFNSSDEQIFRLYEDSRGDIWITTLYSSELLRWERATNTWHNYTRETGFSPSRIGTGFLEDPAGNLWIATGSDLDDAALIRYREGAFKVFTKADGAPSGWTRDLFLDHAGKLWLANSANGLLRLDDLNADKLTLARYTTAEGLSSNGAFCITEDHFGRIYIGTGRGLDRLNPSTGQVESFTTADGLPGSDVQIAYRDRKNALWFSTTHGLTRFLPDPERQRRPPTILITGLQVNGLSRAVSILGETAIPKFDLDSDQKQVNIDFLGLGATLGEQLRFEYRLTGKAWVPTNERRVNFANLSSGNYSFEVRAVTGDGVYSQPATVSFSIADPIWQRWWFLTVIVLTMTALIYGVYRYRLARMLEVERVRTRIATDLHDDIGAGLSRLAILSEVARHEMDPKSMGERLGEIATVSRELVDSMSEVVWVINPRRDQLRDLIQRMRRFASDLFTSSGIEFTFVAPDDQHIRLGADVRRQIFLIFKEATNNVARHSGCTRADLRLLIEGGVLVLTVKDNGLGLDPDKAKDGNGLVNMRERARLLNADFMIDSRPGEGTTITLKAPLNAKVREHNRRLRAR